MQTPRTHAELFAAVRASVDANQHVSVEAHVNSYSSGTVNVEWRIYAGSLWNNYRRPALSIREAWESFLEATGKSPAIISDELDAHSVEPVGAAHA